VLAKGDFKSDDFTKRAEGHVPASVSSAHVVPLSKMTLNCGGICNSTVLESTCVDNLSPIQPGLYIKLDYGVEPD